MFSAKWTIYDNEKPKGTKWKKYNIVSLMKHSTTTTTMTIQDIYRIRPQWKWWRALALSSRPPKIPPVEKKKPSRRFFFRHKTTSIIINSWLNGGQLNNSKNGRLYWAHTDTNSVQNVPFWLLFVYVDYRNSCDRNPGYYYFLQKNPTKIDKFGSYYGPVPIVGCMEKNLNLKFNFKTVYFRAKQC